MEKVRTITTTIDAPCSIPPRLAFYSLPSRPPEPAGMTTPPLRLPVSVPFKWEEVPGKRKKEPGASGPHLTNGGATRRLELPPRLAAVAAAASAAAAEAIDQLESCKLSSPTAVLDGPGSSRPSSLGSCYSFSYAEGRSSVDMRSTKRKEMGAWLWKRGGSGRKVKRCGNRKMCLEGFDLEDGITSSSSCSSSSSCCHLERGDHEVTKENRRNKSLPSTSTSQLWASFCGRLKQAASWGRRVSKV